jgi:hypothetical protein
MDSPGARFRQRAGYYDAFAGGPGAIAFGYDTGRRAAPTPEKADLYRKPYDELKARWRLRYCTFDNVLEHVPDPAPPRRRFW